MCDPTAMNKNCASTGFITDAGQKACYDERGFISDNEACFATCAYGYKKDPAAAATNGRYVCKNGSVKGSIKCIRDPDHKGGHQRPCESHNEDACNKAEVCEWSPAAAGGVGRCSAPDFTCSENEYVSDSKCVPCPEGSSRPGGDIALMLNPNTGMPPLHGHDTECFGEDGLRLSNYSSSLFAGVSIFLAASGYM